MGKKKLTRLILGALLMAGGWQGGTMSAAEAAEVTLTSGIAASNLYSNGVSRNTSGSTTYAWLTDTSSKVLTIESVHDDWKNYIFSGYNDGVFAGASSADVQGYTVNLKGGTLTGEIWAGTAGNGTASNNTVNILGGQAKTVHGGHSVNGSANKNAVNISGGTVESTGNGTVVGGNSGGGTADEALASWRGRRTMMAFTTKEASGAAG